MCRCNIASPFGRGSELSSGEGILDGSAGSLTRSRPTLRVGARRELSRWERFVATVAAISLISGCVQEMSNQPRYEPLEASTAFDDGMASRLPVPGTVARGQVELDQPFFTGKFAGQLVSEVPDPALADTTLPELLARGRDRYNIFCSHCHGRVGGGIGGEPEFVPLVGLVVQHGFPAPPTYHQDRLRRASIGHFFDVITNGLGRMAPHGYLIPPQDRWAIAAYIRALQLSQFAPANDLTPEDLTQLNTGSNN
jgi:mono/diheme cytochrome c family protein